MSDNIIQLTDTSRLVVEYDQDATCPRGDWDMLTGFVKIPGRGDSRRMDVPAVHDEPIPIAEAHDRLYGDTMMTRYEAEELTERWARAFHGMHVEYDAEHGGYWFVDPAELAEGWPDLTPGTPEHLAKQADVIKGDQETYRQWAEGEVYGVILERQVTWARIDGNGEMVFLTEPHTKTTWEQEDALWGCYLDDDYTAQYVAWEHFDLTDDEIAALGLS